jgi:hypothetical protein
VHPRPSHRELTGKIRLASKILAAYGFLAVDPAKLGNDFYNLKCFSLEAHSEALNVAFSEITARDYKGKRPPETSFEEAVHGREFFTFIWASAHFKQKMYLKFCFQESDEYEGVSLYVFSLHIDCPRPPRSRK